MKLTTILTTLLAAVGTATPTSSSARELTSLFNADDAIKLYVQNTTLNALKQDMLKNKDTCAAVAATDSIDNSDKNSTVTTKADTTKADPPKTLEEILHYIWCQQCRDEFDKCMKSWSCWIAPEACSRTCQCDVLRWKSECASCGYRC